jgi:nicotinamide-nucleotide adenylyltransferase
MKIGCFCGRFNPPHNGHLAFVKRSLKKVDKLVIVIGLAQESGTKRNPFSGKERMLMWKRYVKEHDLKNVRIITIQNGKTLEERIRNLLGHVKFDILFTNAKSVSKVSKGRFKVEKIRRIGTVSSGRIKKAIASGRGWRHMTGKSVAKTIDEIGGPARIKRIFGS